MLCPRCGVINPDETERCKRCQGSLARPPARGDATVDAEYRADLVPAVPALVSGQPKGAVEQASSAADPTPEQPAPPPTWDHSGPTPSRPGPVVPNYLLQAVVCTLLFFPLCGIVAFVYGLRVNRRLAEGDWDGAFHASRLARTWCWVSVALGLLVFALLAAQGGR